MIIPYLILCAAFVSPAQAEPPSGGQGLVWEADLATAQRLARESNRLVLIHFGGPWCEPCRRLEKQVFSQPGFGRELAAKYVAVKVDPREHSELAEKYGVRAVPTDVVVMPSGQLLTRTESPSNVAAYCETMGRIANSFQPSTEVAGTRPSAASEPQQPKSQDTLDRYASYYNRRQSVPPTPNATDAQPHERSEVPNATHDAAVAAQATSDQAKQAQQDSQPQSEFPAPPKNPPIALDGYCAVTLVEKRQWQPGDPQWGAIHRGRTYLFASAEAQKAFLADPDRFSPVLSGNDPVIRVEHNKNVTGRREHGAFYNDRIYLFTSEDTFQRFNRDPSRYIVDTSRQARRR